MATLTWENVQNLEFDRVVTRKARCYLCLATRGSGEMMVLKRGQLKARKSLIVFSLDSASSHMYKPG